MVNVIELSSFTKSTARYHVTNHLKYLLGMTGLFLSINWKRIKSLWRWLNGTPHFSANVGDNIHIIQQLIRVLCGGVMYSNKGNTLNFENRYFGLSYITDWPNQWPTFHWKYRKPSILRAKYPLNNTKTYRYQISM